MRRKFLRATQTEIGHASEAFTRLALAHPQIHFTLRHNDKLVHDLPPTDDWPTRIAGFFGRRPGRRADLRSTAATATCGCPATSPIPATAAANPRMQYLFLNGRHIRDRALQHALGEAYRGLLLTGRYPIAFLRLDMPADAVDVNVHPDEAGSALSGRRAALQPTAWARCGRSF